jgi:uncharacterized flavoprotein (TIGR03862 family)
MKNQISIIGGGPSALILAAFIDETKFDVTIYEKNKSVGRKFLVAGDGGFNLTHSESIDTFVSRYTPLDFLKEALISFSNTDLQDWLKSIGVSTFVGSSKRVYPVEGIKPIEVLNSILNVLQEKGVNIKYGHEWSGWDTLNQPIFTNGKTIERGRIVFALGGGSWKVTGSNGSWLSLFKDSGIGTQEFYPSNCAYQIDWNSDLRINYAGQPLKNIEISCAGQSQKGEVVLTDFGLEGNAVYALSPQIRKQLTNENKSIISLDLKPSLSAEVLLQKIRKSKHRKISDILKKDLKLSRVQLALLKSYVSKDDFINPESLAKNIKSLIIEVVGVDLIDKAISTVGGINLSEIDSNFELKKNTKSILYW